MRVIAQSAGGITVTSDTLATIEALTPALGDQGIPTDDPRTLVCLVAGTWTYLASQTAWAAWLTPGDLDGSGTPDSDPNGLFNSLTESSGVLTFTTTPDATARDGYLEGVLWEVEDAYWTASEWTEATVLQWQIAVDTKPTDDTMEPMYCIGFYDPANTAEGTVQGAGWDNAAVPFARVFMTSASGSGSTAAATATGWTGEISPTRGDGAGGVTYLRTKHIALDASGQALNAQNANTSLMTQDPASAGDSGNWKLIIAHGSDQGQAGQTVTKLKIRTTTAPVVVRAAFV